jgi:hypothetical protein
LDSLGFQIWPKTIAGQSFALPLAINGSMTFNDHVFALEGYRFDVDSFMAESKVFGVWFSFHLILSFLAWCSLFRVVRSLNFDVNPLCLLSGLSHGAVDNALSCEVGIWSSDFDQLGRLFRFPSVTGFILAFVSWLLSVIGNLHL